jgi:hypothetical protein
MPPSHSTLRIMKRSILKSVARRADQVARSGGSRQEVVDALSAVRTSPSGTSRDLSYVAEDASPTTADRVIDAIVERLELLAEQPRWVAWAGVRQRRSVVRGRELYLLAMKARS